MMRKNLKKIDRRKNSQKGSFLIEILLTVVILSVSVTLIIQSMVTSLKATVMTSDYSKAAILLEDRMFDYVIQRFIREDFEEKGTFPEPYEDFRYEIKARPLELRNASVDKERYKGIDELEMKIIWGPEGKEKMLSMVTFLFDETMKGGLENKSRI